MRAKRSIVSRHDCATALPRTIGTSPTIFISHDSRDEELAEAFAELITAVSGGFLKPFYSSDKKGNYGIEFGQEWYQTIIGRIEEATGVIALLTQHSIGRPWILYEAGVAKGKSGTPVLGVAIGIPLEKAFTGPFAQLQNCAADNDSLTKLAIQLICRNENACPNEKAVRHGVAIFLKRIATIMKKRAAPDHAPDKETVLKVEPCRARIALICGSTQAIWASPEKTRALKRFYRSFLDAILRAPFGVNTCGSEPLREAIYDWYCDKLYSGADESQMSALRSKVRWYWHRGGKSGFNHPPPIFESVETPDALQRQIKEIEDSGAYLAMTGGVHSRFQVENLLQFNHNKSHGVDFKKKPLIPLAWFGGSIADYLSKNPNPPNSQKTLERYAELHPRTVQKNWELGKKAEQLGEQLAICIRRLLTEDSSPK